MAGGPLAKASMGLLVALLALLLAEVLSRLVAGPPSPPVRVYRLAGEVDRFNTIDAEIVAPAVAEIAGIGHHPLTVHSPERRRKPMGRSRSSGR